MLVLNYLLEKVSMSEKKLSTYSSKFYKLEKKQKLYYVN